MLEQESIQSRGFRNVFQGEDITGFQVPIRSMYYRDLWLSQLRPVTVVVDGEKFEGDQITWTINGKTYIQSNLEYHSDVNWSIQAPAILTINKPGGLELGVHVVEVLYTYSASYMPPALDEMFGKRTQNKRKIVLVR